MNRYHVVTHWGQFHWAHGPAREGWSADLAGQSGLTMQVSPTNCRAWEHSLSFFITKCIAIFNISDLIQQMFIESMQS